MTATWMRAWQTSGWGCVNSPDYCRPYLTRLKQYADLGADAPVVVHLLSIHDAPQSFTVSFV